MIVMTDDWTMPFGKWQNHRLADVPDKYLIKLYKGNQTQTEALRQYIEKRFTGEQLGKKPVAKERPILREQESIVFPICKKRAYLTKDEARKEMQRIRGHIRNKYKSPVRSYECPKCGYWHLTSKPDGRFL